jgi:hypothetical protein
MSKRLSRRWAGHDVQSLRLERIQGLHVSGLIDFASQPVESFAKIDAHPKSFGVAGILQPDIRHFKLRIIRIAGDGERLEGRPQVSGA